MKQQLPDNPFAAAYEVTTDDEGTTLDVHMQNGDVLSFWLRAQLVVEHACYHRRQPDGNLECS
jgi:hypothetical protein